MKKIILPVILVGLLLQICYAGFRFGMVDAVKDKVNKLDNKVQEAKTTLIIRGKRTISGETLTIEPGTTVKFKTIPGLMDVEYHGELVLKDGARLIAKGTADNPIIFETEDSSTITFEEDSDGENSVIEYCKFEKGIEFELNTTVNINQCKFIESGIQLYKSNESVIQYNNFSGEPYGAICLIRSGGSGDTSPEPTIRYNNFENSNDAIILFCIPNAIKYNNIIDIEDYAINYSGEYLNEEYGGFPSTFTVANCYIADCNGKSGVDTDGSQSEGIVYENPQTSSVSGAGCDW